MTRAAVLRSLRVLVEALGRNSEALWPILFPLVHSAIDPLQRDAAQIIEEGLSLWYQLLLHAPHFRAELLVHFAIIPAVVQRERTAAAGKYAARIIEAYALLGKREFLQQYATVVRDVIDRLVSEGVSLVIVVGTINSLLQLFPGDAAVLLSSTLTRLLFRTLAFNQVDTATMVAHYLSVFARLLLHHPASFFAVIEQATQSESNSTKDNLFAILLDNWIARVRSVISSVFIIIHLRHSYSYTRLHRSKSGDCKR